MPSNTKSKFILSQLWTKSFSTPTQNQVDSDAYTEIKSTSTPTLKSRLVRQVRSPKLKSSQFRQPTHQSNRYHPTLESSQIRSPTLNAKSIWTIHTQTKPICMLTLEWCDLRLAYKEQSNFDHPRNNQVNFIPTLKSNSITHTEIKSIWTTCRKKKKRCSY